MFNAAEPNFAKLHCVLITVSHCYGLYDDLPKYYENHMLAGQKLDVFKFGPTEFWFNIETV